MKLRENTKGKIFLFLILMLLLNFNPAFAVENSIIIDAKNTVIENLSNPVDVVIFYGYSCPHCEEEIEFFTLMKEKYPSLNIQKFEVWRQENEENRDLLKKFEKAYNFESRGVPVLLFNEEAVQGYTSSFNQNLENKIQYCLKNTCTNPFSKFDIKNNTQTEPTIDEKGNKTKQDEKIKIPFLGEVNINKTSLFLTTLLIAFADGFNPCSLWVLTFLLGIIIYSGSRKKIIIVGLTFLSVTAVAYGLFILGMFSVLGIAGYITQIRTVIALIALIFAVINIFGLPFFFSLSLYKTTLLYLYILSTTFLIKLHLLTLLFL
jgi:thiol-disulfide isomerase/thioredoxin